MIQSKFIRKSWSVLMFFMITVARDSFAQQRKVWASGMARSVFQQNQFESDNDSITPRKNNSGHALVDLELNAAPNEQTYLNAMVRIRNDFGGFWGSGVTFDVRQLYLKGLIKNSIRYQLGDFNYKLTPYTFYSNSEELSGQQNQILDIYRNMVHQDWFLNMDNTWRQQGGTVDFGLQFDENKLLQDIDVTTFVSRVNTSIQKNQNERIFYGGAVKFNHNKNLASGVNYVELTDIRGTSKSTDFISNSVLTGMLQLKLFAKSKNPFLIKSEVGTSKLNITESGKSNGMDDYFYDVSFKYTDKKGLFNVLLEYRNVGPGFRSVGSQSKRVNWDAANLLVPRYSTSQMLRPLTSMDIAQDAALFRYNFNIDLDAFNPWYDNINPYGKSTPNRKGFTLTGESKNKANNLNLKVNAQYFTEIIGQGIANQRDFYSLNCRGQIYLNKFFTAMKRELSVNVNYAMQNTLRTTNLSQADIKLNSAVTDLGFKWEFAESFFIIFTFRNIVADGNEFLSVRNTMTEVIDFTPVSTSLSEKLILSALQYKFSANSQLTAIWQKMNWNDSKSNKPAFGLNQFAIVYNLNF